MSRKKRSPPAARDAGDGEAKALFPWISGWPAAAAVLLFALALRAPIAAIPLERDEGGYAYIAQRWLLGDVPYKTSFDQKTPGIDVVYAAIIRFVGSSASAIHWGTQVYLLGALVLLFLLGKKMFSGEAGVVAAAVCAPMLADPSVLGNAANSEVFMVLPLIGSMLTMIYAVEEGSDAWALLTGLLLGAACLFKQVALADAVLVGAYFVWKSPRRWALLAWAAAGGAAALSATTAYFAAHHAAREFYDCVLGHNLSYAARMPLAAYAANAWSGFSPIWSSFWPVYLAAAVGCATGGPLAVLWLVFSFLGVSISGYYRGHYFIQIVPAISLLAGAGITKAFSSFRPAARILLSYACAAALIGYGLHAAAWYYSSAGAVDKGRRIYFDNPFPESVLVGRYIAERSTPNDTVFVFGSEPQIMYYAERRSASRYIYAYPLMAALGETAARQREALAEIAANAPKFIVTAHLPTEFLMSRQTPMDLMTGLGALLSASYRLVAATPLKRTGEPELIVGETLEGLWRRNPMWYDKPAWASLLVWERKPPPGASIQ
ncbi:MAG: glycosyltransferase family 39 protein [Elusimicrobiota bacterium]